MLNRPALKSQAKKVIGSLGFKLIGFAIFVIIATNIVDYIVTIKTPPVVSLQNIPRFDTLKEYFDYFWSYAFNAVPLVTRAVMLVYSVFVTIISVGFSKTCLMAARGEEVSFRNLFDGFEFWLKIIGANILISILTTLGTIFFIIPGLILALCWSQTYFVLIDHPEMRLTDAMRESRIMMRGHKEEFFVFQLSFILWYFLSSITYGVASIWVLPYVTVCEALYYDRLCGLDIVFAQESEIQ